MSRPLARRLAGTPAPRRAKGSTIESLEPRVLLATFTVTNVSDGGAGSLRQAILNSNASAGVPDTIVFNVGGGGAQSIAPASALPAVTDPVVLDATTQPGYAGAPLIELNGSAAGAASDGLTVSAGNSTIEGFVINRFGGNGITLQAKGNDKVAGNYIGLNAAGRAASPNGGDGLLVSGTADNTIGAIGGISSAVRGVPGNVISGNGSKANFPTLARDGIHLLGAGATGNLVVGNLLGTDATGSAAVGNSKFGIELDGALANTVGGAAVGAANVVSANTAGIELDNGAQNNVVQGNRVGTGRDPNRPLGNALHGIVFGTGQNNNGNLIGGTSPGAGNVVAFNGTGGIALFGSASTAVNNPLLRNSIYANGQSNPGFLLGIDLVPTLPFPSDDGVTANDALDADTGPNNLQNAPALAAATVSGVTPRGGGQTAVAGSLDGAPNGNFRIEFFASSPTGPGMVTAHAQGQTFLGFVSVSTGPSGAATFSANLAPAAAGQLITATATDAAGNTSEFSTAVVAQAPVVVSVPALRLARAAAPAPVAGNGIFSATLIASLKNFLVTGPEARDLFN